MRIAIDGTHSTGKTTIHNLLKIENYKNYEYIPEMGSIIAKSLSIDNPLAWQRLFNDKEKYKLFVELLVSHQKKEEMKSKYFIVDSSLYRVYTYAIQNGLSIADTLISKINYDLIFYCPIEFDFIEDNFRFDFFRNEIDKNLLEMINKYHHGKFFLLSGSVDNRIKTVKQFF